MAGIRGIRSFMPKKGKSETGIFSSRGSQKMDDLSGFSAQGMAGNKGDKPRKGPVKRNNKLGAQTGGPSSSSDLKNGTAKRR